jgi:hypothetical protein
VTDPSASGETRIFDGILFATVGVAGVAATFFVVSRRRPLLTRYVPTVRILSPDHTHPIVEP